MSITYEDIQIRLGLEGERNVNSGIDKVKSKSDAAHTAVTTLTRALAAVGVGFSVAAVVNTLASFSQELSTVRAITGATADQTNELEKEFRELGKTTRFSASEAAQGAQFLARAGFDTDQILGSLSDTLLLAQAGALDLGSAADIASNVLTSFRLETDQAGRVVDVLAKAANSSNTDVRQLGDALKFVAPIAAGIGVELEETTAAIGALSDAGLQGSMAGTGLRQVLSRLEKGAPATTAALDRYGLSLDDVRPSTVGLTEALQRLSDAGVDTGAALELFGDRGGPAFEVLLNSIPTIRTATEALNNAGGTARTIADIMDDNLNGAMLRVRSAFQELILSFGDLGGMNILTLAFQGLATVINIVSSNLSTIIDVMTATGAVYVYLNAQTIMYTLTLNAQLIATRALTIAQWALNAAFAANPMVLLLGAIVAVTAAIVRLTTNMGLVEFAVRAVSATISVMAQLMAEAWDATIGPIWTAFADAVRFVWDLMIDFGVTVLDVMRSIVSAIGALIPSFGRLGQAIAAQTVRISQMYSEAFNGSQQWQQSMSQEVTSLAQVEASVDNVSESVRNLGRETSNTTSETQRFTQAAQQAGSAGSNAFNSVASAASNAASSIGRATSAASNFSRASGGIGGGGTAFPGGSSNIARRSGSMKLSGWKMWQLFDGSRAHFHRANEYLESQGFVGAGISSAHSTLRKAYEARHGRGAYPARTSEGSDAYNRWMNFVENYDLNRLGRHSGTGFRKGGQFMVGGAGGVDNNAVQFMASRGERVTVETRKQQREADEKHANKGQGTIIERIEVNVFGVSDPNDFRRTERQIMQRLAGSIQKAVR